MSEPKRYDEEQDLLSKEEVDRLLSILLDFQIRHMIEVVRPGWLCRIESSDGLGKPTTPTSET